LNAVYVSEESRGIVLPRTSCFSTASSYQLNRSDSIPTVLVQLVALLFYGSRRYLKNKKSVSQVRNLFISFFSPI
jgi:hypothetical protein